MRYECVTITETGGELASASAPANSPASIAKRLIRLTRKHVQSPDDYCMTRIHDSANGSISRAYYDQRAHFITLDYATHPLESNLTIDSASQTLDIFMQGALGLTEPSETDAAHCTLWQWFTAARRDIENAAHAFAARDDNTLTLLRNMASDMTRSIPNLSIHVRGPGPEPGSLANILTELSETESAEKLAETVDRLLNGRYKFLRYEKTREQR